MAVPRRRRFLLRALSSPPVVGAVYVLALVVRASATPLVSDDAYTPGPEAKAIAEMIATHYGWQLVRIGGRLAVASLVFGAVLGALAGALVDLRDRAASRNVDGLVARALRALVVTAALHGFLVAWTMARKPQPFVDAWYAAGGLGRWLEVGVTSAGPRTIAGLAVAALAVYLGGSRSRLAFWAAIARGEGRGARRLRAAALVSVAGVAAWEMLPDPGRPVAGPQASVVDAPGAEPTRVLPARLPNVLILAADGLRADRFVPSVVPRLAAVADRGTTFERAYVAIPHTVPSWVGLLTGRDPHHHGVRSIFPRFEERTRDLDALPTRLARAGYFTAVVSDFAGDSFHDTDLGWVAVDAPALDFPRLLCQRAIEHAPPILPLLDTALGALAFPAVRTINTVSDPRLVAEGAIRAIRSAGQRPFFVTAFFSTSHFPYAAPAPYYERYTDPGYRGPFKYHRPVGLAADREPDPADVRQVRGLYDGALASVDDAAGLVLDYLERSGLSATTIVVVTSDHGESLFEHGRGIGHGDHLFGDHVTHVPLVVHDPRHEAPRREAAVVRSTDLAPTLYDLTGVQPPGDLDGRSLARALGGPIDSALAFAETDVWLGDNPAVPASLRLPYPGYGGLLEIDARHGHKIQVRSEYRLLTVVARHRMVRDDRWKLVYAPTPSGARTFLYDTLRDADEIQDVAGDHPDEVERLSARLWAWMLADPELERRGDMLAPRAGAEASKVEPGIRIGVP